MSFKHKLAERQGRSLFKFIVYILGLFLFFHALVWVVIIPFRHVPKNMETRSPYNLKSPLESIVWGKSILAEDGPHLVVIGPSTTFCAFPAGAMAPLFKGYRVQDFTLNGINIRQSAKILELLTDEIPPEKRHESIFIVGIYFGSFTAETDDRYTIENPLDGVPHLFQGAYRLFMEYIMAVRATIENIVRYRYQGDIDEHNRRRDELNNTKIVTESDKQKDLQRIRPVIAPDMYFSDTFDVLRDMAKKASADGVRLVLVDMPQSKWMYGMIPHDECYQRRLAKVRPLLDKLNIPLINMRSLNQEDLFCDWAHARPRAATVFSSHLAMELRKRGLVE